MKKYIFMFFLVILTITACAQSYHEPNWNSSYSPIGNSSYGFMRNNTLQGGSSMRETMSIYPRSFRFEGTIEYKNGYTYLRVNEAVMLLIIPKKEGLTLDTQEGKGVKAEVWGYLLPTPRYALIVHVMYIDGGLPIWEPTILTLIDKFPLY